MKPDLSHGYWNVDLILQELTLVISCELHPLSTLGETRLHLIWRSQALTQVNTIGSASHLNRR